MNMFKELLPRFVTEDIALNFEYADKYLIIYDMLPVNALFEEEKGDVFNGWCKIKCLAWLGFGFFGKMVDGIWLWDGTNIFDTLEN